MTGPAAWPARRRLRPRGRAAAGECRRACPKTVSCVCVCVGACAPVCVSVCVCARGRGGLTLEVEGGEAVVVPQPRRQAPRPLPDPVACGATVNARTQEAVEVPQEAIEFKPSYESLNSPPPRSRWLREPAKGESASVQALLRDASQRVRILWRALSNSLARVRRGVDLSVPDPFAPNGVAGLAAAGPGPHPGRGPRRSGRRRRDVISGRGPGWPLTALAAAKGKGGGERLAAAANTAHGTGWSTRDRREESARAKMG